MNKKLARLSLTVLIVMVVSLLGNAAPVFAANPSANLDQCANDPTPSPSSDGCNSNATQWVNGNLGASKAVYFEGDSIPYRLRFDNLSLASHTVTIEWDTTKSGKHALDYIDNFNQSVLNADPCLGVSNCNTFTSFAIPADPQVTGAGVTPIAGSFRLYGGSITAVSAYLYPNGSGFTGDKSARITITFTAGKANPVLAWGGHISTRLDWGALGSAVAIPGSPYHTRLINLDGSGGNQDRSLSADAVVFKGSITIIKDAVPNDAQDFSFSTTGGLSPATFSLDDDANGTLSNTQPFTGITNFTTYTVTEASVAHWTLSFGTPVCTVGSPNGGSQSGNAGTGVLTINLKEGENVTCTFINTHNVTSPTVATTLSSNSVSIGTAVHDSATLSGVTSDAGGTVTYTVYSNNTCTTSVASGGTKTVTNGIVPDSDAVTFNSAGTFYWQASYSGDANNSSATSDCTSEQLVVNPNAPTIATVLSDTSVAIGTAVHDSATLSGATANAGGTVTYTVYSDSSCTTSVASGGTKTVTNGVVPDSDSVSFNSAGTFYWQAAYSGDANNDPATSACTSEIVTVNPNAPSVATQLSATSVSIGGSVHDSATLSSATSNAGGTVTYTVYTDSACTQGAQAAGTKTVTNGSVPDSDPITFNSAGTFYWQAVYSGDGNNSGATSTCTEEQLVVTKNQPSNSTAQNLLPNDSFTLSGATANAGGTVTFNLYAPSDATCSGAPALTQTVSVSGNATYNTTNTTFFASAEGTWRWLVSYSGDANNEGTTSACGVEQFTIANH